jgi:nitrite reductase (NO-forming)
VALGHRWLPEPRWLLIHLILLGAASHAILVWSQHFSYALLHTPATEADRGRQNIRLILFNAGAVVVVAGVLSTVWLLTILGAAAITAAVIWHMVSLLLRFRRAMGVRFAVTIWYYVAASAMLPLGVTVGVLLARGFADPVHGQMKASHAVLNVLGWIGLTVLGTLVTLWPTMLRTKIHPRASSMTRRLTWVFIGGLLLAAAGSLSGHLWIACVGLGAYLIGLLLLGVVFAQTAAQRPPVAMCTLSVAASYLWFVICVAYLLIGFIRGGLSGNDWDLAHSTFTTIAPFFAAGFVVQVLIGSLSYLIPVLVSSGPASSRAANIEIDRGAVFRVVAANLALVVSLLPVPSVVLVLATMLYLGATASFLILMFRAMRAAKRPASAASLVRPTSAPSSLATSTSPTQSLTSGSSPAQASAPSNTVDSRGEVKGRDPYGDRPAGSRAGQAAAAVVVVALVVGVGVAVSPSSIGVNALGGGNSSASADSGALTDAPQQTIQVEARDMKFFPDTVTVPSGTRLIIEVHNTDTADVHDLVFTDGRTSGRIAPNDSAEVDLGIVNESLDGWCSILGHKQMGMTFKVLVEGATSQTSDTADVNAAIDDGDSSQGTTSEDNGHNGHSGSHNTDTAQTGNAADLLDFMAEPHADFTARDAVLPELPPATGEPVTRKLTFEITEQVMEVAPGVTQELWTFNGQFPGPALHGRVGDTFEITLVNNGTMGHSIDFHASNLAPDEPMRTIPPGESLVYTFTAERAGIWMYHCGTMPMTAHIANGMAGAVVIEPDDLPAVDKSYLLVQSELYLGSQGGPVDVDKALGGDSNLDIVAFNGYANQYVAQPLSATVGERVRIWTLDVGPSRASSFHIVGGQFDRVWFEGAYLLGSAKSPASGRDGGSQALAMQPAQGGFVELTFPEAGNYTFVTHIMADAERGARGIVHVTD